MDTANCLRNRQKLKIKIGNYLSMNTYTLTYVEKCVFDKIIRFFLIYLRNKNKIILSLLNRNPLDFFEF